MDFSEYSKEQLDSIKLSIDEKKTILLSANWGVGKTHFIKSLLKHHYLDKKIRYVSLFGIETLDRLIQKLLDPQIDLQSKTVEILGNKMDLSNLDSFLNGGANIIASQIKDEIIVLDDLERSNLDYTLILGLIDKLKENNAIIFICNRNKINAPDFLNQIEKVSDRIVDSLSIDFNTVMKKIIPESILNDVLYSFFILKEDNLRIAIKLGQLFELIKDHLPFLSYKEIRLLSCLAIEKNRTGYLNDFYEFIAIDPFKKIETYLYNREVRINPSIEKKIKLKQDCVELQDESLKPEYLSFMNFITKIGNEEFYHTKPSLLSLIKHEFLDEKEFIRQTYTFHPLFKTNNLPNEILYPNDLVEQSNEITLKKYNQKLINVIENFNHLKAKDSLVDFNVLYHLTSSHFVLSKALSLNIPVEISIKPFSDLIKTISDEDIKLIKHPNNSDDNFELFSKKMKTMIYNEKTQRKDKQIFNILKNNDTIGFYKNNYDETIFDHLNPELLDIIANNYIQGSKLSKDIIAIITKNTYMSEKQTKRDQATVYLKTSFTEKENEINDIIIKRRINSLLTNPTFNKINIPTVIKKQTDWHEKITEQEYFSALGNIKKEEKNSPEYLHLRNLIVKYEAQVKIDAAESSEYKKLDLQIGLAPGDKVRLIKRHVEYKCLADIGGIYTLKAKAKFPNTFQLWETEELEESYIGEGEFEKVNK